MPNKEDCRLCGLQVDGESTTLCTRCFILREYIRKAPDISKKILSEMCPNLPDEDLIDPTSILGETDA